MQKSKDDELYYKNNISGLKNSNNLSLILTKNFFKINHKATPKKAKVKRVTSKTIIENSQEIEKNEENIRKKNEIQEKETFSKHYLIDFKRYFPEKFLKYEINLYDQSKKYAPNKCFETGRIYPRYKFLRKKPKNPNEYTPSLNNSKSQLYNPKFIVYCKNKFCSSKSFEISPNNIKRCQSARNIHHKKHNSEEMIKQVGEIVEEVVEKNDDVKKEIHLENEYHKLFYPKTTRKVKNKINIEQIKKELQLGKDENDQIEQEKILLKNYNKVKICLDERCKSLLRQIYNQINYEDSQLNKQHFTKNFSIENYKNFMGLKKSFKEVSKQTLRLKKELKGKFAIIPPDDAESWNKMIKKFNCSDISDKRYFDELLIRKNAFRIIKSSSHSKLKEKKNPFQSKKKHKFL